MQIIDRNKKLANNVTIYVPERYMPFIIKLMHRYEHTQIENEKTSIADLAENEKSEAERQINIFYAKDIKHGTDNCTDIRKINICYSFDDIIAAFELCVKTANAYYSACYNPSCAKIAEFDPDSEPA